MESKKVYYIVAFIVFAGLVYFFTTNNQTLPSINSFEECVAAGNPVMESYPRQCNANGQTFTEILPEETPSEATDEGVFCTMDAKLCPDGSYVGRTPPDCEFEACPGE